MTGVQTCALPIFGITPAGLESDIAMGQELGQAEMMGDQAGTPPVPSAMPATAPAGQGAPSAGAPGVPGI